jgi:hypothetical protein
MPDNTKADRTRAEAIFKAREERRADAPQATQDYRAKQDAILERTKRLRQERLTREAAEPPDSITTAANDQQKHSDTESKTPPRR